LPLRGAYLPNVHLLPLYYRITTIWGEWPGELRHQTTIITRQYP